MTKFDKVLINGAIFAFILLWMIYLVENIAVAIFIAILITVIINRLGVHFFNRKADKSKIGISEMENLLALYGNDYQIDLLFKATPEYFTPERVENGILFTMNCEKAAAFTNYKYSPSSPEDIAKFYRLAKKYEVKKVYILSRANTRNVLVLASSLDIAFVFVTSKQWHRFLYRHNLLMESIKATKHKRQRRKFSEICTEIFQKKRAKYFFLCALTFGVFCLISPYKLYYLIMTSIVICLGIVCILRKEA